MHVGDKYLPYSPISKLDLNYFHFLIFLLSCNSSNAKRTFTFDEIEEDHEEGTTIEYTNAPKHKKARCCYQFVQYSFKNIADFATYFLQHWR
jgi:hypothetical protein